MLIAARFVIVLLLLLPLAASAGTLLPFDTSEINNYLIIGNGPNNEASATVGNGTASAMQPT